jgi:hypothetical protein
VFVESGWIEVFPQTRRPDAENVFMLYTAHDRNGTALAGARLLGFELPGGPGSPTSDETKDQSVA